MKIIDTTKELKSICKILKKQKVVAIDCEFIREKTYYPIPCLIQVGYEDGAFLIDPLIKDMEYDEFINILQNKKIMKVFHSGRQDIEILYNISGKIPTPVFDTQIAAQVCGLGECVSYENLVRVYCGVELDKSCYGFIGGVQTDDRMIVYVDNITGIITEVRFLSLKEGFLQSCKILVEYKPEIKSPYPKEVFVEHNNGNGLHINTHLKINYIGRISKGKSKRMMED